jgi:type IV pilus assembly protein PilY1
MNNVNLRVIVSTVLLIIPATGYSARPDFAQEPLFIGSAVAPNLMFLIDDSGSMDREYMPDDLSDVDDYYKIDSSNGDSSYQEGKDAKKRFYYSSKVNKMWYDPTVTYKPPLKADGTGRYPDSSYTSAPINGYVSGSTKRNLSNKFDIRGYHVEGGGFYWVFKSSSDCDSDPRQNKCYSYVSVNNLSASEKTNFANWYSYYNTRNKSSRAGISEAFFDLPPSFRLGWGRLNYDGEDKNTIDDAYGVRAVESGVREYTSARREQFFKWLYTVPSSGNTPLRRALDGAGTYYENSLQAWADDPSKDVSDTNPARECRLAYSILMSDGYYNGSDVSDTIYKSDDKDGQTISNNAGDSYIYKPVDPFKDNKSSTTLADVAMHYWKRDLRSDVANYVPNSKKNPAFWQHMVTYTVGLGVTGTVDPKKAFEAIDSGSYVDWWGGSSSEDKVNDMLHAAVNGRGGFFSAADPETFATELAGTVGDIVAEAGSSTAVEFDVSSFQKGALIFSTQFDPNGWTGDLKAAKLGGTNSPVVPDINEAVKKGNGWSARAILDARDLATDDRVIVTYGNGASGFRWANLTTDQKADLRYGGATEAVAKQRLSYIRGDTSLDGSPGWRKRGSRLGSIVNSSPEFVGEPRAIWPDSVPFGTTAKKFSDFAKNKKSRTPVVYTGSNDGMLHGFKGTTSGGDEVLAYIPEFVYNSSKANAGLHFLTDPGYQHRYYVDLEIRQQDIFTRGKKADGSYTSDEDWRSIIVGGGRAGAKGIFALDVTDPATFSEANAEKIVLWEFTGTDNAKMGYVTQAPIIAMAKWGATDNRWTAFVSNGYNSTTSTTGFFMLDIEGGMDGSWDAGDVRYVEFESGGDGLSPLAALDTTGDYLVDRVYAGDLDGNLWVASVDASGNWGSAYKSGVTATPLFTTANNQAITAAPVAAANNKVPRAGNQPNLMVYFGTGQYLESSDVTSNDTQSVYGIWDRGNSGLTRSSLESRTITEGKLTLADGSTPTVRYSGGDALNFKTVKGWYVDLPTKGERAVVSPQVRGEFLYLNSMIPDQNPCLGGGRGWLMAFGLDGRTPEKRAFLKFPKKVAGYQSNGLPNQSTILGNYRFTPGSKDDDPVDVTEIPPLSGSVVNAGRRGWNELINE